MLKPTICLMLKAPVEGRVKTRLARDIGHAAATRAYRALVVHQLRQIDPGWDVEVHVEPAAACGEMRAWLGTGPAYVGQADGDLGDRLRAVHDRHFATSASPLVFIGGDCPYLTSLWFARVLAAFDRVDAAIVPAIDGGYCLLALRKVCPGVFANIAWGTPAVLAETRERLLGCGQTWEELPPLEDVDDLASWHRALATLPSLAIAETA